MGSYDNCNNWDYDNHPKRRLITARCNRLTKAIRRKGSLFERFQYDTRPAHRFVFSAMMPSGCSCIAGSYRGTHSCGVLLNYRVNVAGREGAHPASVESEMQVLQLQCALLIRAYREAISDPALGISKEEAFLKLIDIACDLMESIFTIHPYANGNGHMGRLLVWFLLSSNGFHPPKWSVDTKQPYDGHLKAFRSGNAQPLKLWLIRLAR